MSMKLLLITAAYLFLSALSALGDEIKLPAGVSDEEALRLGETMYREGILPSGKPMQAIVMGDIPVDGRMFTCDDCHQRSGLGSVEGTVITWPTNGKELYKPRRKTGAWRPPEGDEVETDERKNLPLYWQIENARPAYTDRTLARVLLTGLDPAGRKLNPVMPLYLLSEEDMGILVHYLKNLSVEPAPGVDDSTIRFATVVTNGTAPEDRQAMLATLQAHIDAHNSQSRHQERRSASGPFFKTEMYQAYRRLQLDVWELKGVEETWPAQLENYYAQEPVFALLGGLASGSWRPIHEFCEQHKIPAIFPLTDFPVVAESDWYTLYFSKGLYQSGEAAARFLHTHERFADDAPVVVVFRENAESAALRQGFAESWRKSARPEPQYVSLGPDDKTTRQFWLDIVRTYRPTVLILWLGAEDLGDMDSLAGEKTVPTIFLSSEMLRYSFAIIPENMRESVYLTYPRNLPETWEKRMLHVKRWLQARDIPVTNLEIQAKMYFLGWMLPGAISYLRSEFFRDYFLEGFDMMTDQDYAVAVYPRLTFGSGQRYASKGCYIVQLTGGPDPRPVQQSDWVIH
jgi:hypothetical protein